MFPTNSEVIVPINCYGQGQYYQSNTTYILKPNDTYFTVSSNTYQGLSTCYSLMRENSYHQFHLFPDIVLQVPLRCACPTTHQIANGTMYLLTYLVNWDDTIPDIADRFHVSTKSILEANGFPDKNPNLTNSTTILIPLPTEPSSSETITHHQKPFMSGSFYNSKNKRKVYIVLAISLLIVLSVILAAVFLFHRKIFRGFWQKGCKDITVLGRQSNASLRRQSTASLRVEIADFGQALKVFEFSDIMKATGNFSNENRIKGSVYRRVFGQKIFAVKNMSREATEEVKMLKKINHFNLIKLEGVCEKHGSFYLVFEYMENGSLREWLNGNKSKDRGSWNKRIQIALDVANGLHYLHHFTEPPYIHMDIKSSNILLNSDLRAKIANFGLARAAMRETSSGELARDVVVTRGYMAPEYGEAGPVTPKVDVYAYGVLMLELITGKDAYFIQDGREEQLSAAIVSTMEAKNLEAELSLLVDPTLDGNNGTDVLLRMAELSVACLTQEPDRRPTMWEIVSTLLKIQADLERTESFYAGFNTFEGE